MDLQIIRVSEIDEKVGTMSVEVAVLMKWKDERLAWNASLTDHQMIIKYVYLVPGKDIWSPDITLINTIDNYVVSQLSSGMRAQVYADGTILWNFEAGICADCELDLHLFPFDRQSCPFIWAAATNSYLEGLNLSFYKFYNSSFTTITTSPTPWKILGASKYRSVKNIYANDDKAPAYLNTPFQQQTFLTWHIEVRRYHQYYVTSALLPNLIIASLAMLSLWIKDYPARLALLITSLLSVIAVLVSSISLFLSLIIFYYFIYYNNCVILYSCTYDRVTTICG